MEAWSIERKKLNALLDKAVDIAIVACSKEATVNDRELLSDALYEIKEAK